MTENASVPSEGEGEGDCVCVRVCVLVYAEKRSAACYANGSFLTNGHPAWPKILSHVAATFGPSFFVNLWAVRSILIAFR